MKNAICFLLVMFAVQKLQAGDKILNGGNVIVCGNSIELLDYYEARLSGKQLQFDSGLNTYSEKLNQLFDRWKNVAPKRMALYSEWLTGFESEAGIYSGIKIPDILDTGSIAIPSGCVMTPVAFQRRDEDIFPGEKRYVINKDLWDQMNQDQKAGLVLHELIYREAIKNAHSTSLPTRYFNSFLATEVKPDAEKYFSVAYKMPLAWAEYSGMNVKIGRLNCQTWGNPGCNFYYESESSVDRLKLNVIEIFETVTVKDIRLDFYDLPCEPKDQAYLDLTLSTRDLYFRGCESVKSLYIKDSLNVTDIKSKTDLLIRKSYLDSKNSSAFMVEVDPKTSWYQSEDGVRIENFKAFGKDQRWNKLFQSVDGKIWIYSSERKKFEELVYNVQVGVKDIPCYMNTLENYQCPSLPKQFTCNVKVTIPYNDYGAWEPTTIKLVNNVIEFDSTHGNDKSHYSVVLPKGQTIRFIKKRFGKMTPEILDRDARYKISWEDDGSCYLRN
jgi:hypothetical protein